MAICPLCSERIAPGEPIAWGGPHQQIHERCLEAEPRAAARTRWASEVSAATAIVELFREDPTDRLCLACVALRARTSLEDAQRAAPTLEASHGFSRGHRRCDGCGREVDVIQLAAAEAG